MLKHLYKKALAYILTVCVLLQVFSVLAAIPTKADEVTPQITFSYLKNRAWTNFTNSVQSSMDGIKIQTSSSSPYYLQYRTLNQGQSGYYSYVKSNINDYAGSNGKPIQQLQIQAYKNDGTKLTSGIVVMYRAYVDGAWLPWVSNADLASMQSVQSKYGLGGSLDGSASFAGKTGKNISGIEIRVYDETGSTEPPEEDLTVGEVSASMSYMVDNKSNWISFDKSTYAAKMDGIKIQTSTRKPYYLKYRTHNSSQADFYSEVSSTVNDYAGSAGKPIQKLGIRVYKNDGTKLTSGVIVMYRAFVDGAWMPWVSNADPQYMRSVQSKYNLGGNLDTSGAYTGVSGKNVSGIEIRIFEDDDMDSEIGGSGSFVGNEIAPSLSYMIGDKTKWTSFSKSVMTSMDGLKIQTDSSKPYYIKYRTWNAGQGNFYPTVTSIQNDYAGSAGKQIQKLGIQVYSTNGTKMTSGVVVMYRAYVDGAWMPWVSNADPEYMRSVQSQYNLGGTLDTSGAFTGKTGKNIAGIEIRVFEGNVESSPGGDLSGGEVAPSLSYMIGDKTKWTSFNKSIMASMDGLKIQTGTNKSYYIKYRTHNAGQSNFYPEVTSIENDYAGSAGKPIQKLGIRVYSNAGVKLTAGVVVMYRAYVNGVWMPWVSNADPEWMQLVQVKYNLGGTLNTSGYYTGVEGQNISGIEIRVFEETSLDYNQTPTGDYKIIQAPFIYQMDKYPTGCESVAAVMALQYAGINISVDTFIDKYLDRSSGIPFDPNSTFGGNPRSTSGFGCYAPVIKKALDKVLASTKYKATQLSNVSLEDLCSQYIDNDIPVIMWATRGMESPKNGASWIYNGKKIQWIRPEHCLLLVGYDDYNYIFNDSMRTQAQVYYSKASVEAAYRGLFSQAIVITAGNKPTDPSAPDDKPAPVIPSESLPDPKPENKKPIEPGIVADPVDLSTGSHIIETSLLSIPGGFEFSIGARYNSSCLSEGLFGIGWNYSYEKSLEVKSDTTIWVYESPSSYNVYEKTSNANEFVCTSKSRNTYILTKQADGSYVLNRNYDQQETYNSQGQLVRIENRNQVAVTVGHTDTTITFTDTVTGKHIYLTKGSNGKIEKISDDAGREVVLGYTNNFITSITDVNGNILFYTYDENGRIKTGTDHNNVRYFEDTYDDQGRIICQYDGVVGSRPTLFSYGPNGQVTVTNREGVQSTRVFNEDHQLISLTDENGNTTTYAYDDQLNLISETDALGNTITTTYNSMNKPLTQTDKLGNVISWAYDSKGNVISITFPGGADVTFSYNNKNLIAEQTDLRRVVTTYTYDDNAQLICKLVGDRESTYTYENGLLKTETDPLGNTMTYTYNDMGQPISVTDASGDSTTYTYDNKGNVLSITDALGHTVTNTYDSNGQQVSTTDANGNTTWYTYTGNMKLASVTYPNGGTITYEYDGEDRLVKVTDQNGNSQSTAYDAGGRTISTQDYLKAETSYEYDAVGRVVKQVNPNGGVIQMAYDANGNMISKTDPAGNTTTYEYDEKSQLVKEISAVDGQTVYTYNDAGDRLTVTDALGNVTEYQYDAFGNMISVKDPRGNTTVYTYNANNLLLSAEDALGNIIINEYDVSNRLVSFTDQNGHKTIYTYDAAGREISQIDPNGHTTTVSYDPNGNVLTTTDAKGKVQSTIVYNSSNQAVSTTDAAGNTTTSEYDLAGRLLSTADALSNHQEFTYDRNGRLIESKNQMGSKSGTTYDLEGNVLTVSGPLGANVQYTYDDSGRLTAETTPSSGTKTYGYNALNLCSELINARGQETQFTYDALGRITGYTNAEGTASYTYDENGNVLTATDANGTITREYDELNRVVKYTDVNGNTIQYSYDAAGNLSKMTYPDNTSVTYSYDAANNLVKVTDWAGRITTYTYDENNNVIGVTKPDGSVTTTVYDDAHRVLSTVEKTANGTIITGYEYVYDELGRVVRETSLADNKQYDMTYDALSRVTERKETDLSTNETTTEAFTYDEAGNITSFTVSNESGSCVYDSNNRLVSYNGHTISYDADGNMISGYIGGADIALTYDSSNRLLSAGGNTYTYDVENNRITNAKGTTQKTYTYNTNASLSQLLVIEDENGGITKFVYGLGLIGQEDANGFKTYHYDYRGSTVAITDESGNVVDTFTYDTYGQLIARTGTTDTPFMYNGRDGVMTDANGLLYMRARYYSPELKRFINADIIVGDLSNSQTLNRYAYANGNPISNIDPFGLSADRTDSSWLDYLYHGLQYLTKPFVDGFKWATQKGYFDWLLKLGLGATPDDDNIYHIRQDWWQSFSLIGYNNFYDVVFDVATKFTGTSMLTDNFKFTANDKEYVIWLWKDYINLGSGAEAGIYEYGANLGGMDHWLTATDTKLKMELELYDKTLGETLFTYEPKGYTWWITGFDPSHPNAQGDNLTSTVTIHFDENTDLFEGFYNTYKNNKRWNFDGYSATIKW